jgi:osmotically-inducible protein OsmY
MAGTGENRNFNGTGSKLKVKEHPMKAAKQHQLMRMYAVLTIAAVMVLGLGLTAAASDWNNNPPQYGQQGQNQGFEQNEQWNPPSSSQAQSQTRDLRLEQQIAGALRQAGYGAQGEIMILATGDQVTLLGTVPGRDQKSGAEQIVTG